MSNEDVDLLTTIKIVMNRRYVSFNEGVELVGGHPAKLKDAINSGKVRVDHSSQHKRKMSINAWDCLKIAQI